MKITCTITLLFILFFASTSSFSQQSVSKTNTMPVYMHYMPWFDTPQTLGGTNWGWHWTMNNKNPEHVDQTTGKREIASHFYPLIGPYASSDPDVLEYHFLLMKLSGIDGVLIDWYGEKGSNGDVGSLLTNSNAIVAAAEKFGLKFAVVMEDRFTRTVAEGKSNIAYLDQHYFTSTNYFKIGGTNPLVTVFGPITFEQPSQWTEILSGSSQSIEFLPLWQESSDAGNNADGEYAWIWEDEAQDNYLSVLETFYKTRAAALNTVMGVAYPGFVDFYKEGGAGDGYFEIPHDNGATLKKTLELATKYKANFDVLQLATWNDFGEGTIFEPTYETDFKYLEQLQQYTGVNYRLSELLLVIKLYNLRKLHKQDEEKTAQLDQASAFLNDLKITEAKSILNTFETITGTEAPLSDSIEFQVFPNPVNGKSLNIKMTGRTEVTALKVVLNDLQGREIARESIQKVNGLFSMSTEKIAKGAYVISMHFSENIIAKRLIVLE